MLLLLDCDFENDQLKYLKESFETNIFTQLKILKFNDCEIDDALFRKLVNSMPVMPNLNYLAFKNNEITDKGMVYLSKNFHKFPSLITLSLRSNSIGKKGIASLSKEMSKLTKLQLFQIDISDFDSFLYYLRCNVIPYTEMLDNINILFFDKSIFILLLLLFYCYYVVIYK